MQTTATTTPAPATTKWVIDPAHSEITFRVKHLMISNVKGRFRAFAAEINGNDFTTASIRVNIDAASISTNEDARDNHLRSADFFDVENFPEITFEGTSFKQLDGENYALKGILAIKGISKETSFKVEFGGIGKDPWGNEKAGFSLSGKINRKDWGLNWNAALEAGGVLVSEEVNIQAEVQFVKQK